MSWNDHWKVDDGYVPLFETLRQRPTCVLKQSVGRDYFQDPNFGKPETLELVQIPFVPNDGHIYWLYGHSLTPCGIRVQSVFVTTGGGSGVIETYWHVNGTWYKHYDTAAHESLKRDYEQLVPFSHEFAVPVEFLGETSENDA